MGFIDSAEPSGGEEIAPVETDATTETPADDGGTTDTPAQEPQRTEKVVLSRKERSIGKQQAFEKQLSELKETFSKHGTDTAAAIAQRDAEIARLRGGFDVLAPLIARQQQAAAPPPPDPNAMMREAKKALDAGDFDLYQQKVMEATEARIFARLPPPQQQVQQAPGTNPVVTAIMGQFPTVLNAGERGLQLAIIKDQELAVMGYPNGPDRYRKAFELASNMLQPAGSAQYSQNSREVLSGVPPARSGGGKSGNGEAGVHLSAYELSVAEKCGMTREEYAKYIVEADPKRLER